MPNPLFCAGAPHKGSGIAISHFTLTILLLYQSNILDNTLICKVGKFSGGKDDRVEVLPHMDTFLLDQALQRNLRNSFSWMNINMCIYVYIFYQSMVKSYTCVLHIFMLCLLLVLISCFLIDIIYSDMSHSHANFHIHFLTYIV